MEHILTPYLQQVKAAPPVSFGGLAAFPLDAPEAPEPRYLVLDDALAAGLVTITEVSSAGAVPTIRVTNTGPQPVLILDGEELVGAKQNRMVNLTLLVPARSTLDIPVSCVEAGRWHDISAEFRPAGRAAYADLRARKMERVTANLRDAGSRAAGQGEVWEDIDRKSARMGVHSGTGAMADIFERTAPRIEAYVERLRPAARGAGIAFAIGGEMVGLDLFDCRATLARLHPKIIRSYALDALERGSWHRAEDGATPGTADVAAFIADLATGTEALAAPALGEGMDVRLTGPGAIGAALVVDGRTVHLCAFRRRREPDWAAHGGGTRYMARRARALVRRRRLEDGD